MNTLVLIIGGIILGVVIIGWLIYLTIKSLKHQPPTIIDFNDAQSAITFLNIMIKEKYNYYNYIKLLPLYNELKIPENKLIQEIKHTIFLNIRGSLSEEITSNLLKYFSRKGLDIYINEKIIVFINQVDYNIKTNQSQKITSEDISGLML